MPTYAENLIGSVTVGAGGASTITFSSIPSTYTDLVVRVSSRNTSSAANWNLLKLQFNTDTTAANYSYRLVGGFGTTAYSASGSDRYGGYVPSDARTANTFGNTELYIPNYTGSTNKSFSSDSVTEGNGSSYEILGLWSGLWSNTAAINQIVLSNDANNFAQYTTAYLYGITGYTETGATSKATGGVVTSDATYYYHTFNSTGTFTPLQNLTVDYLVVAGGGGGGNASGNNSASASGGGAGGLRCTVGATGGGGSLESALSLTANTGYSVIVGSGGAGATTAGAGGSNGSSSAFATITSTGGGAGGGYEGTNATSGGSGGGAIINGTAGSGTANQGYAGGAATGNGAMGAGGGGAGAVGGGSTAYVLGVGGNGVTTSISGSSVTYAGGGGGGGNASYTTGGAGGSGGGGAGGNRTNPSTGSAGNATTNTGSGGGGGSANGGVANTGGNGGSGIVIIRYAK